MDTNLPPDDIVRQRLAALQPNRKRQNREAIKRLEPDIVAAFSNGGAMPSDVFNMLKELGYSPSMSTLNRLFKQSKTQP